jgi:hypothetical protein
LERLSDGRLGVGIVTLLLRLALAVACKMACTTHTHTHKRSGSKGLSIDLIARGQKERVKMRIPGWPQMKQLFSFACMTISRRMKKWGSWVARANMIRSASCVWRIVRGKRRVSRDVGEATRRASEDDKIPIRRGRAKCSARTRAENADIECSP